MAATCMAVCKGSRKKIRGIFISSCHLPVAVECDIVILSEPGPIPQAPVGQFCRHNLSPRGDGNWGSRQYCCAQMTQLIPARGRKPVRSWQRCCRTARHNLSPRGDGNSNFCPGQKSRRRTQLIPARGRKHYPVDVSLFRARGTQLIPARGRKHYEGNRETSLYGHNLSPRGDGNLLLLCSSVFAVEPDTTYPREGTETF